MQKLFLFFFLLITPVYVASAQRGLWDTLAKVTIKKKTDPSGKYQVDYPEFANEVKALDGKEITIKGYIIPLQELGSQDYFVLSALPFNMCYFCGGAGPETVMEIRSRKSVPYTTQPVTLKGRLQLNSSDSEHLMYILNDATIVN